MLLRLGTKSDWGKTRAQQSSDCITFRRKEKHNLVGASRSVVDHLLGQKPRVNIQWVSVLHFQGTEVIAGVSWLSCVYDGEAVLAYIPEGGIFKYEGEIFFLLHKYPVATIDDFGLPSVQISKQYVALETIVHVDSQKMTDAIILSMAYRLERSATIDLRFVSLQ